MRESRRRFLRIRRLNGVSALAIIALGLLLLTSADAAANWAAESAVNFSDIMR
jgi:hypothetical protein